MTILEQAYQELESKSIQEKYTHNLSAIFQNARDTLLKDGETDEATKAQYEIDFLNFNINSNKLSFLFSGTNEKGEPVEYPAIKQFTEDTYNFLIDRQKKAKSVILKARYSHILWLSSKKKIEYAKANKKDYYYVGYIAKQYSKFDYKLMEKAATEVYNFNTKTWQPYNDFKF